jgi:hypothetical protein
MDHLGTHAMVSRLVAMHPEKSVDILVRCCEDGKVRNEIISCFLQHEAVSPSSRLNMPLAPPASTSLLDLNNSGFPHPPQRLARHPSLNAGPFTPISPPRTASSTASHSTKNGNASGEYILFPTFTENGIEEKMVRMRTAPIRHSVIRDAVLTRSLNASLSPVEGYHVSVPDLTNPDIHRDVLVSYFTKLTWRRPSSDSTHSTTFYVVSRNVLDTDVLLGDEDSGEVTSGVYARFLCDHTRPFD